MYADDIALVADSQEALQEALNIIDITVISWGMQINVKMTKVMVVNPSSDAPSADLTVELRGQLLESVNEFKYLGSICAANFSMQPEIANRLSSAGHAYHRLQRLMYGGTNLFHSRSS